MKPMLAGKADIDALTYPLGASPKLDGIRALIIDSTVVSRTLKPIRNKHVQSLFGKHELNGLDGELIVGKPTDPDCYRNTSSGVMSEDGEPDVRFHVFDTFAQACVADRFVDRLGHILKYAEELQKYAPIEVVPHNLIADRSVLELYESTMIDMGYEGVMLRDPTGPYKQGRSTQKEGYLLKLKRFEDSEAEIVGSIELFINANEAKRNALGNLERSSAQSGKIPANMLGAWELRDIHTDVEFECGTGFSKDERVLYWKERMNLSGNIVKYKFFPHGVKDKPRHPVFLGFRDEEDIV